MKTIEELAALKSSDLVLPTIVAMVEETAKARRVARRMCQINSDLKGKAGRHIEFPKAGLLSAQFVAEGDTPSDAGKVYTHIDVDIFKIATGCKITQESIESAQWDVVKEHIDNAGEAMADLEDKAILAEAIGYLLVTAGMGSFEVKSDALVGQASGSTYQLVNGVPLNKVLTAVDSVSGNCIAEITEEDYSLGKIKLVGVDHTGHTVTFRTYKMARTNFISASTVKQFNYADIIAARSVMVGKKMKPDLIFVNPTRMSQLLVDAKFTDKAASGKATLETGEIGTVAGMTVVETENMPETVVLLVDSSRFIKFVDKRSLDVTRWTNPATDGIEMYFWQEFAPKVIWEDAACAILEVAADSANL